MFLPMRRFSTQTNTIYNLWCTSNDPFPCNGVQIIIFIIMSRNTNVSYLSVFLSLILVSFRRRQFTNHCRISAANSKTNTNTNCSPFTALAHTNPHTRTHTKTTPNEWQNAQLFTFDRNFSDFSGSRRTHTHKVKLHKTIVMIESVDVFFGFVSTSLCLHSLCIGWVTDDK